ncbi:hypothetical protein ACHAWF_005336 [Thalassiosira exigua]
MRCTFRGEDANIRGNIIRKYYEDEFCSKGSRGTENFVEKVYQISGVSYSIMTNIPFSAVESQHWRPKKKSALRVDPLLAGDKRTIDAALKASGYGTTLADVRQYLNNWYDTMQPEYMMETDNVPSVIDEQSDYLTVLMKVCEERNLPIVLKIDAHRGVYPTLLAAGDGMVAFADTASLARLLGKFSNVRFLATFLSRANQHEACVLQSKFRFRLKSSLFTIRSIIEEITQMRVEMLGTTFTAQHSDARVMDQLIYKWAHSRAIIGKVLAGEYVKVLSSGWKLTREEIRRDISRLFGGAYEDFMKKIFVDRIFLSKDSCQKNCHHTS